MPKNAKPTKQKGWLIVSTNWDYNDEYYTPGGVEVQDQSEIYTDKAKAEKIMLELERQAWQGIDQLSEYTGGSRLDEDVLTEALDVLTEAFGEQDWDDWSPPNKLSDEQVRVLRQATDVSFYDLVEVTING